MRPIEMLVVPPAGPVQRLHEPPLLPRLQALVGGYIEAVILGRDGVMYVHGEGKLVGAPRNPRATELARAVSPHAAGDYIAGTAVLCGVDGSGNEISIPRWLVDGVHWLSPEG